MTVYDLIQAGHVQAPPCAQTLGFDLIRYCPETLAIEVVFQAKREFQNPAGHIQGGFLCAMLDDVMGPALVFSLPPGQFAPTLELKVQFLRPALSGRIHGFGHVVSKGKRVGFLEGRLEQDGQVIATATATALMT